MSSSAPRLAALCTVLFLCVLFMLGVSFAQDDSVVYHGASDASAGVMLDEDTFVMADDENNVLRIYNMKDTERPVGVLSLSDFLRVDEDHPEADIEGAARVGDRVYWITSHGRSKDGKLRPSRYRLFATDIRRQGGGITLEPVGRPCRTLLDTLLVDDKYADLDLEDATRLSDDPKKKEREKLAPKEEGLNIEGLAAGPDGKYLYIALRNPLFAGKGKGEARRDALVIPLLNPVDVIEKGVRPLFGSPALLGLGGLGVRSMEYCDAQKMFYIIAGPRGGASQFALYTWSGEPGEAARQVTDFTGILPKDFSPEALFFLSPKRMVFLSDDGTVLVNVGSPGECVEGEYLGGGKCPNKYLLQDSRKTFRSCNFSLQP